MTPAPALVAEPPRLLDESRAETRVEFGMARAEVAQSSAIRAHAEQLAAIEVTLREARDFPHAFVEHLLPNDNPSEFAERAVAADLAVRLGISEGSVRTQAYQAERLRTRTPQVWAWFRDGEFAIPNARVVAELSSNLPSESWEAFDAAMVGLRQLAPARFRARAAAVASRLDAVGLTERHRRAADERRVWTEHAPNGMAWFNALLPVDAATRAYAQVDKMARSLAVPGETRTIAQLRADVTADLLAGVLGTGSAAGVTVAITVPVMTLLGLDEAPGTLNGMIPIDADTARRLTAHAPSFTRILTHPITGCILEIDGNPQHIPADLKRWVRIMRPICDFAGCGRPASECDIDHTIAKVDDGTTSVANLGPLCRNHHRLKHQTTWTLTRDATGITWTSPTGHVSNGDPPPF